MHNGLTLRPPADFDSPGAHRWPWTAAFAFIALLAGWSLLVGARGKIMSRVPAAAPFYAALGLEGNARRLGFDSVVSRMTEVDGLRILVVEGEIRNLASASSVAPRLELSVLDAAGQEIYHWTAAPPKSRLDSGETARFRARLAAPPPQGREVRVRFASAAKRSGQGS
jgi:hypothetical protein